MKSIFILHVHCSPQCIKGIYSFDCFNNIHDKYAATVLFPNSDFNQSAVKPKQKINNPLPTLVLSFGIV